MNLRRIRDRLGMTQPELAKELGVATETICRWEKTKKLPRNRLIREHLERLAIEKKAGNSNPSALTY